MVTQYDEKGKIFTQVITKKPIAVIIQTADHQIHGMVHVRPSERVMDELNSPNQFIAVTQAQVIDAQQAVLYKCDFLTLNKDQIVWIIPDEEVQGE
jgi:Flp pilus assembly secretin CpaC